MIICFDDHGFDRLTVTRPSLWVTAADISRLR
jgi:hypothetical protein